MDIGVLEANKKRSFLKENVNDSALLRFARTL